MKLWDKGYDLDKEIEAFTVGDDFLVDQALVKYDCIASIAHAKMLNKIKLLNKKETDAIIKKLEEIMKNGIEIKQEDEDCHTAIEKQLGKVGKKIHTARSRNDQVLTAIRLYTKEEVSEIEKLAAKLAVTLQQKAKDNTAMPGYTHMRKAMPSTVKLWLTSFVDSLKDDLTLLEAAKKLNDQNPLGSAAGYGINTIKIDKEFTTKLLSFKKTQQNPIYCQNSRGKIELAISNALSQICLTINKLATDLLLFSTEEFNYIQLPKKYCTGSSIMPQKHNPDVLELIRAKTKLIQAKSFTLSTLITDLPSGYNRDLQLLKKEFIEIIQTTKSIISITEKVISGIKINKKIMKKAMTKELYATDNALELVKKGVPFRDAYKKVALKQPRAHQDS